MFNLGKRLFIWALALIMAVSFSACGNNANEKENNQSVAEPQTEAATSSAPENSDAEQAEQLPPPVYQQKLPKPNLTHTEDYFKTVPYVGLYNAASLEAYYTEQPDEKIYPASLTKMVTASVALKYCSADMLCKAGTELNFVQQGSSIMWLGQGMELTLEQLIYGLFLPSGNDAAYTLAVNVARSIEGNENLTDKEAVDYFCGLMNEYCKEIGAVNSNFANPEGWDNANQYTTVADLAKIYSAGMKNPTIMTAMSTPNIKFIAKSGQTFNLTNSNLLINPESEYYCENIKGGKTGTTDLAGACLVSVLNIDNDNYILVVANCENNSVRFTYTKELIEFAHRYHYASKVYKYANMVFK